MRLNPAISVAALLAALLSLLVAAPTAHAGEAEPPPKKAAQSADTRAAGEIGRALLSSDEAVRRKAVARLLKRIEAGGDLGAFLDAMSRATRGWADRHERLMEVWLHDAVHGNAQERERAVRLLTALGEKAIRRLALELRHARTHGRAGLDPGNRDEPPPEPQAVAEAPPAPTPRVYDLRDLFERGMNPVQLRGLLQKEADAVEVKQIKMLYIVTALDTGHTRLDHRLDALRASSKQVDAKPPTASQRSAEATADEMDSLRVETARKSAKNAKKAAGAASGPDVPGDEASTPSAPQKVAADAPAPVAPRGAKARVKGASWNLAPALFHLPGAVTAYANRAGQQRMPGHGLPRALLAGTRKVVRTEDFARADAWMSALRRIPDARTGLPLHGATRIAHGRKTALFAGKQIHYSKSVRRTKGGAWTIVTGTIPHGVHVEIALRSDATTLRVDLVATHTEVGLPIPVVRVRPSQKAAPVELERPEWSTTRLRRSFDLPLSGGAALVSLKGLGQTPDDHLVLALTLKKPVAK